MSEENNTPAEDPTPTEETKEPPKAEWEYKTNFKINDQMKDIIQKTIKVSEMEVDMLRKKLDRLTYGG